MGEVFFRPQTKHADIFAMCIYQIVANIMNWIIIIYGSQLTFMVVCLRFLLCIQEVPHSQLWHADRLSWIRCFCGFSKALWQMPEHLKLGNDHFLPYSVSPCLLAVEDDDRQEMSDELVPHWVECGLISGKNVIMPPALEQLRACVYIYIYIYFFSSSFL
jgi:hypothetical protein